MSDERRSSGDWDRSQWPDEGTTPDAPATPTWDRTQMEIDDTDEAGADERSTDARDPAVADDAGPLSGGGHPPGEGHWERVDEE